jgi:hypothetical protein
METEPVVPDSELKPAQTSVWSRLLNVIASPGEVFEEVKNTKPTTSNWLVPTIIFLIVAVISSLVIFSQPAIMQKIHDQQASALDEQVKIGKITQAQADQAMPMIETITKVSVMIVTVLIPFFHVFWWAFVLWLMASVVLKIKIPYMKAAEVAGLAAMVLVLGAIVSTLLTVITGKLGATLSPALALSDFNVKNKLHMLLAALNVFNLWLVWVSASGLSRLTGAPFAKALLIVAIYWLAFTLLFVGIGAGQMAM